MRVMLIEDNLDHAELVKRTLEEHQTENTIHHCTDGQSALDYLLRQGGYEKPEDSPRPHVILLDLRLPRVDGLEVLQILKQHEELRVIPIVVLTTSETEKDIASAYQNHVNSYLVKPIGLEDFSKLMKDLSRYWLGLNAHPHG